MNTNKETMRLYWQQMRKYKPSFFLMLMCIPIAALLLDIFLPYLLSQAIGAFSTNVQSVWYYLWIAAGAAIVGVSFNLIGFQSAINHESAVRRSLIHDTISRLLSRDQDFFANQKIGALTGKFIDFINAHLGLQDMFILRTLSFGLSMSIGTAIIFSQNALLGAIVLGLLIALIMQVKWSIKLRAPLRKVRKDTVSEQNGAAADTITNNLVVKTFAGEDRELRALDTISEKYQQVYRKDFRWMSVEGSLRLLVMSVVQIIAIAVIANLLISHHITLAIGIFTVAYLQRIAGQLFSLSEMINGYDKLFLQAAPMTEILLEENKIIDRPDATTLQVTHGSINFENMTYAYPDTDESVIESLKLSIAAGSKVGLVGKSGAGKTTITRLLLRFDDLQSGRILIDDQDISHVTQSSLRHAISFVPQEPMLFHRSLRENIAYGKPDATDAEIRTAAKQAHALEFIEKLPEKFDTVVGERGVKLSGGQRQRIAIARAILKDAPILVLDEATSALDSESEKLIQASLETLMKNRTSIVIAHRLSTIAKLDRIVVLDHGTIIEDGSHAELLKKNGIYASLWKHQSGGFIEE